MFRNGNRIKAHMRMEERYETLSLIFKDDEELFKKVTDSIDEVKLETGMSPFVFEKVSKDRPDIHGIIVEFHDDIHRVGGGFFTKLLDRLDIDKCEADI